MGDKWDQSICSGFSLQSQARLQDRIGAVAGKNQFLFFAERHNDLTALDTLSQPETLSSLKCAGHDKIGMEMFHVGQNPIFEAYFNGEISDSALELYIMNSPTNLEENMGTDEAVSLRKYVEIIQNAKAAGVQFYGLSTLSGFTDMDREDMIELLEETGRNDLGALKIIDLEQNKAFYEADPDIQRDFIQQIGAYLELDEAEIERQLIMLGPDEAEDAGIEFDGETIQARLEADPLQAEKIRELAGESGMTIVYGGFHLWRIQGDIDNTLGEDNSAVISFFENSKEFWQEYLPQARAEMRENGIETDLENVGDYQFDATTNTWYDSTTDENYTIEVPPGMQPKDTMENPLAAPIIIPITQSQER